MTGSPTLIEARTFRDTGSQRETIPVESSRSHSDSNAYTASRSGFTGKATVSNTLPTTGVSGLVEEAGKTAGTSAGVTDGGIDVAVFAGVHAASIIQTSNRVETNILRVVIGNIFQAAGSKLLAEFDRVENLLHDRSVGWEQYRIIIKFKQEMAPVDIE